MIILAVDPGFDRCGLAVIEKVKHTNTLLYSACVTTSTKDDYLQRLFKVGETIRQALEEWRPDVLSIEKLFFATNRKTASQISEVRGMILYLSGQHDIAVVEYTPLQIKQTVAGFGGASKKQVAQMVEKLIELKNRPKYDDEFDAIAIGLTASAHLSQAPRRPLSTI